MDRRDMLKALGLGTAVGALGIARPQDDVAANTFAKATKGLPPLKITNVKAILTAPQGIRLAPPTSLADSQSPVQHFHVQPPGAGVVAHSTSGPSACPSGRALRH